MDTEDFYEPVTCDSCDATSEAGWGDSPHCIDCHIEGLATEGELCEHCQRTFYGTCPICEED